jgi:phosphopantothenoylcysteine synthetase/decarboxylase
MSKLTFLILSGPTKEYIDPVRFIGNESSGKMGAALVQEIMRRKQKLIFITGPALTMPKAGAFETIKIISAVQMFEAVKENLKRADILISAAAIADYRVKKQAKNKIKKNSNALTIELVKNPDIAAYCVKHKRNQVIAGFALETEKLLKNAKEKMEKKGLDLILANTNEAFGADKTNAYIIRKGGEPEFLGNVDKREIARRIVDETIGIFRDFGFDKKSDSRI